MSELARALLETLEPADLVELAAKLAPLMPAPAVPAADSWLNSHEAAAYLGLSLDALHKRTRRRSIPAVQEADGGKLFFRRSELDRWRLEHANGA